jgi:hypothetical protein
MRVEFQLTYNEYLEALLLARKRLLRDIKKQSRRDLWIGMAVFLVIVLLGLNRVLDWLLPSSNPALAALLPWQDALRPYFYFLVLIWMAVFGLTLLARRRLRIINRLSWEGRPQLHQIRTVELTDAGVIVSDRFARTEYHWSLFRRLEETPNTFLLYTSEMTFEIVPKRALQLSGELDRFRALMQAKLEPQSTAFPVLPVATPYPLPPPPLPPLPHEEPGRS